LLATIPALVRFWRPGLGLLLGELPSLGPNPTPYVFFKIEDRGDPFGLPNPRLLGDPRDPTMALRARGELPAASKRASMAARSDIEGLP